MLLNKYQKYPLESSIVDSIVQCGSIRSSILQAVTKVQDTLHTI